MDVRQVSFNRPGNSNMFCSLRELYRNTIYVDGVDKFLVGDCVFVAWSRESEKLCLLRSKGHVVLFTAVYAKLKKILKKQVWAQPGSARL